MKKLMKMKVAAFTLVEMLIVLVIISTLLLLFVPNLSKQKDKVQETGAAAVIKVVESQAELYELYNMGDASLAKLVESEAITAEQSQTYKEYYAKHKDKTASVAP
ncbi:prepilin-type N-terminal cleavage/methylation domain-containing protein [Streptococcus gallolyticus]|uniref:competence type IV pilus major pilin ComGC n=1 Tax=Streptococcus hepaticus TaxID=3349163 RepID=UPI001C93EBD1|nr:prepilin-type N-terminal cleavage/methylation domain-containing protein [Streptococcus gallolyticus]MBY5040838.1 prepilin-type N-terminal cleavage/methylation domain-containing protein [Streptococcus gallolyticus]